MKVTIRANIYCTGATVIVEKDEKNNIIDILEVTDTGDI